MARTVKSAKPLKPNLTSEERKALQNLRADTDIKILPADKGKATVVINTSDYKEKLHKLLDDRSVYEVLKKDPTTSYKNKLINTLKSWKKDGTISDQLYHKIYPTSEEVPKFYGLPKIHKKDAPLRPIVSSIGSITYPAAKYLTSILNPLVGKNPHFIKNSEDFVKKIADLEVPPPRKLVSYDVTALFTSIPIEDAIDVVRRKLEDDTTLNNRCELSIDQVVTLLEFCLKTTYFVCDNIFYRQIQGAPMGSPVSPVVANLKMEDFEVKALASAVHAPQVWFRYVDDTFTVLQEYFIEEFTDHINSLDSNIKFTIEEEQEGKLPFLDVLIEKKDDGTLKTCVYRKATHTDQYLNFDSNHHLEHKRSVVRTLLRRADTLVSEEEDKQKEVRHVKEVLKINGYKEWTFRIPKKKDKQKDQSKKDSAGKKFPVCLPYIPGTSEQLSRIFKTHGIPTYCKPTTTLRQLLVKPKDQTPKEKQCSVIYNIQCNSCQAEYIGETARTLGKRFKEHSDPRHINSAVVEHTATTGHSFSLDDVKVIGREDKAFNRKVKEAIAIHKRRPAMNRDHGHDIAPALLQLLALGPVSGATGHLAIRATDEGEETSPKRLD